ncbi:FeoA family protein [Propioniciclava coleopterorum]|nr:FeoA family protein [Propioniciclava coleopterorum]
MPETLNLAGAPMDTPLLLTGVHPDHTTARRLASLGLRRGSRIELVQRLAGGGRIVSVAGGRVAVDAAVLRELSAEVAA